MSDVICTGWASHFRLEDLPQWLTLRRPLRCRICNERVFVFLPQAMAYKSHHAHHVKKAS
jgi:hypothetical protein